MKTSRVTTAIALLLTASLGTVMAQEASITMIPSTKGEKSSDVIAKLEGDLNTVKPVEKALGFMNRLPTRWKISQEELDKYGINDETLFIEVTTRSDDETQTAVYNAKGDLVKLKEVLINQALPKAAMDVIINKYNDWKLLGNIEVMNTQSRKSDFIKVKMSDGLKRKALFFSPSGIELDEHLKPMNN